MRAAFRKIHTQGTFRTKGFTLIELLVVIAIIAILAAILFPVFNRMREGVRQASCISNMHEIYQKLGAYKLDHSDENPPLLLGYAERTDGLPWQTGDPGPVEAKMIKHGFLFPTYLNDISKFQCPDNPNKNPTLTTSGTYPVYPSPNYTGNSVFNLADKKGFPFKGLPAGYQGKPIFYYMIDSYDLTSVLAGPKTAFQITYNRDWTGLVGTGDSNNQLKYNKPPADKTVITWCNYHATVAGSDMSPLLFDSGTCKPINSKKIEQWVYNIGKAP